MKPTIPYVKLKSLETQLAEKASQLSVGTSVESFAKLANETDDTARFQRAVDAVKDTGGILTIDKSLTINGSITAVLTKDLNIATKPGVTIDGTGSTAPILISIGGSKGSSSALLADVTQNSITITTNLSLTAGDIVLIQSTDLWDSARSYYYKGEMAEVESVSGTTITLKSPLYDGYASATTTISKLTMPKVTVSDLIIKRNSNHQGLVINYAKEVSIDKVSVSGSRDASIRLVNVFGGIVTNCNATDSWYSGTGTSYGLVMESCQNVNVYGGRYIGGRHGITNGGTTPNRHINIDCAFCSSKIGADAAALDFHGNVEFATIENCYCVGDSAINYAGTNGIIENNRLLGLSSSRPTLQMNIEVAYSGYLQIAENKITSTSWNGVELRPYSNSMTMKKIVFENNLIDAYNIGLWVCPTDSTHGTSFVVDELVLNNNAITATNNDACIINRSSTNYMTITLLKIEGGVYSALASNDGLQVDLDSNSDVLITSGAKLITGLTGGYAVFVKKARNVKLINAHILGISTGSSSMIIQCSGVLQLINCTVENFRNFKGLDCSGLQVAGSPIPTLAILKDNIFVNAPGSIRLDATTKFLINSGTLTYSGDGTTTSKTIPHGLNAIPSFYHVERASADAGTAGIKYVTSDATNLTVFYNTAPISGTNNVILKWKAEV